MSIPADLDTRTAYIDYADITGDVTGSVRVTLSTWIISNEGKTVAPFTMTVDVVNSRLEVALPINNDPNYRSQGYTYRIEEHLLTATGKTWSRGEWGFNLPSGVGSLNIGLPEHGAPTPSGTGVVLVAGPTGPTGPTGPQGPAGAGVGDPGPAGPAGPNGPAGPANALSIGTVSTGAAGSGASAAVTGTSPNQTLSLAIPGGDTGVQGVQGVAGPVGPAGPQSTTPGPIGPQGPAGPPADPSMLQTWDIMPSSSLGVVRRRVTAGYPARPTSRTDVTFQARGSVAPPYTGPGAYISGQDIYVSDTDIADNSGSVTWGYYTNRPSGDTPANWDLINDVMNGTVRRSFSTGLPSNYSSHSGAGDAAVGATSFWSVKPPNGDRAGVAAGTYDATITSFATSCPNNSYGTMFHEPEDDMTGAEFVAMFNKFYSVAKAANPTLKIGYAAMEYQWDLRFSNKASNPDDWMPAATDWLGVDVYGEDWHLGNPPMALQDMPGFARWYAWAATKGKPLVIAEIAIILTRRSGSDPYTGTLLGSYTDQQRATWTTNAINWIKQTGKFQVVLWWNGDQAGYVDALAGNTAPHDSPLALAAWNAGTSSTAPGGGGGPIPLANGQSASADSGTADPETLAVTLPAIQSGDFVMAVVQWNNLLTSVPTFTGGWTLLNGSVTDSGSASTAILYKAGSSADSGAEFRATWTTPTTLRCAIQIHTWHGVHSAAPVNAFAVTTGAGSTTHVMPTVTSTAEGGWVVNVWAYRQTSLASLTPPAGMTQRDLLIQAGTGTNAIGVYDSNGTVATGSVGGGTYTSNVSTTPSGTKWTIVLKPSA